MTTFRFNDTKGFDANIEAFLDHMDVDDPEMADILRAHVSKLKGATDDTRRRAARIDFNASVSTDLDALLTAATEEAGG